MTLNIPDELVESAREWLEQNPMSRDPFIYVVKALKEVDSIQIKDKNGFGFKYVESKPWMKDVSSPRKLYEYLTGSGEFAQKKDLEIVGQNSIEETHVEENTLSNEQETKYVKQIQNLRDENIRLRRVQRNDIRNTKKVDDFLTEMKEYFNIIGTQKSPIFDESDLQTTNSVGIIQLSDLHLNELINEPNNVYDFKIAAKRLRKLAQKAIDVFLNENIYEVYILNTGDNINSNRRRSELINMATSRARACVLATKLLSYFINDIEKQFKVNVAFVSSNESRIDEEMSMDELSASDNFDIIIYEVLKMFYNQNENVNFIDCDLVEGILNINDKNILITHGYHISDASLQKTIQTIKGKYASRGILIDYVMFGDKHSCYISDKFARSSSLCGGNGYSDNNLSFDSAPSQNIYIVNKNDSSINGMKICLNKVNNLSYDIEEDLEKMDVRSLT